jgi:hypothetical protein
MVLLSQAFPSFFFDWIWQNHLVWKNNHLVWEICGVWQNHLAWQNLVWETLVWQTLVWEISFFEVWTFPPSLVTHFSLALSLHLLRSTRHQILH